MKNVSKSFYFRRYRLFGWNIYRTRENLKHKPKRRGRSRRLSAAKASRLKHTDGHCEICGISIDRQCSLHHLLPEGHPQRNAFENVRVICPQCKYRIVKLGEFRPMIGMAEQKQ